MTSVAYAVTLFTVAVVATIQFATASKAEAVQATVAKPATVSAVANKAAEAALKTKLTMIDPLAQYGGAVKQLTGKELSNLLYHVGFQGQAHKLAWGIVMRESTARPMAHNDNAKTGDNSYGIFQINMIGSLGTDRRAKYGLDANSDLFNPVTSAKIAYQMSGGGSDFGAWGLGPNAYRSGAGASTLKLDGYPGIVTTK
jgi:hypothetical protein